MKTLNVRCDPRAWLCVLNDSFFDDWVQLSGEVEVVACPLRWNRWSSTTAPFPGASGLGRLPRRHDQTAPLLAGHADQCRSDRLMLTALLTGPVKNRVYARVTTNDGRSSQHGKGPKLSAQRWPNDHAAAATVLD